MGMRASCGMAALATALVLIPAVGRAKTTTVTDVTLDVPDGYKVSSSKRGVLIKTPDGSVDVWVETFLGSESEALFGEHARYWKKESVDLGQPTTSHAKSGDADVENTAFPDATWKGEPTVLRYSAIGPFGSQREMILVTYWASPKGNKDFGDAIGKMLSDVKFKYPE